MRKRCVDIVVSACGLMVLAPLFGVIAVLVRRPVFFGQVRIGRYGRPFRLWKFRTMRTGVPGPAITVYGDTRITPVGHWLRRTKLDELPQLWNILRGEMSLVGPRPELPQFVALYAAEYARVLQQRPGLTDAASLLYRHEEQLLAEAPDPMTAYTSRIFPAKLVMAEREAEERTLWRDLKVLLATMRACLVECLQDDPKKRTTATGFDTQSHPPQIGHR